MNALSGPRTNVQPRILAVVSHFPMPQNHGDALRRLMVLQSLTPLGELTVACVTRTETTLQDIADLRGALPTARILVGALTRAAASDVWGRVMRTTAGVLQLQPPWIMQQWSRALQSEIRGTVRREGQFDYVVFIGEASGRYARLPTGGLRAWDKSNVLVGSELGALTTNSSARARLRAISTLPFSWAFERRVLSRVDSVWVSSAEEGSRLKRYYGRVADSVIPSMLTLPSRAANIDPTARVIVWMSTFSYSPNWDGLARFLRDNRDYLSRSGSVVRVAGARATAAQERILRSMPFVEFKGFVEDLYSLLDGASVAVVPVWSGAGVKLKTLTFLAHGVPVIATPVGMEGVPHHAALAVVSGSRQFSQALETMTTASLEQAAARGRATIMQDFSPEKFAAKVRSAIAHLGSAADVR